tara:strand:+ start:660 stop:1313 length:654 start_codon:yes stop_codon:yes gene_type:complete
MNKELYKRIMSSIILIPLTIIIIVTGSYLFNFFILLCFVITLYEWHMMSKKRTYNKYGFFFLIFSFYSVYFVRNELGDKGLFFFLFILIVCICTDIGGYTFGKVFKGPKLTNISPKKTYSGVIGSYILPILIIYILLSNIFNLEFNLDIFEYNIFVYVIFISSVSQVGDIIISYFKRLSKIKDTGNIIPGHGGILDRIDGMIFVFPFFYVLNLFFKI